jgi:ComF family protein
VKQWLINYLNALMKIVGGLQRLFDMCARDSSNESNRADAASRFQRLAPTRFQRLASSLKVRALPQRCFFCSDNGVDAVCVTCATALPRTPADACPRCQLPSVSAQVCGRCIKRPPPWQCLVAPWRYEFPLDRALVAGKHAAAFAIYQWFADVIDTDLFAYETRNEFVGVAALRAAEALTLIPVPASSARLEARGFNQSEFIAHALAKRFKRFGLQVDSASLVRIRDTETQHQRNWAERRANIRGAFAATQSLSGQRVLLIDDVLTTGATMGELSRVALAAGALTVDALVIARAQPMRRRERIAKFGELVR